MSVFDTYAAYYDALYAGKDYAAECDFIEAVFARFGRRPQTLLDLACGTGGHGIELLRRGYQVCGVDRAPDMLARFGEKAKTAGFAVELLEQDLRALNPGRRFDAACCMFDAIGYLTENRDLLTTLHRLRGILEPGGVFVCDFWHAATVLRAHEATRVREFSFPDGQGLRISTTTLDPARQVGNVTFRVLAFRDGEPPADIREVHPVRYFLPQEMRLFFDAAGWRVLHLCPAFELDRPIGLDDWHLVAVATPA